MHTASIISFYKGAYWYFAGKNTIVYYWMQINIIIIHSPFLKKKSLLLKPFKLVKISNREVRNLFLTVTLLEAEDYSE